MISWHPPRSPFDLIQEHLYRDPWKVLVSCIFCNLTRRRTAEPLIWKFFETYPTPQLASKAQLAQLETFLQPLGLSTRRAKALKKMSQEYISKNWKEPIELYGVGKYANDAWKIFCTTDWKNVKPKDHALVWYHDWLINNFENK